MSTNENSNPNNNTTEVTSVTSNEMTISKAAAMAIDKILNGSDNTETVNKTSSIDFLAQKSNEQEFNSNPTVEIMRKEVMRLYVLVENDEKSSLIDKILFGDYLLKIKLVHKNEFYKVIGDEINKMKVGRSIKLILKDPSTYAEGMSTKNKDSKVIEENLKLLVADTRITSLKSIDDIQNLKESTTTYLEKLKELDDEDFWKVIDGNEKPLEKLAEKKKKKVEMEKEEEKAKKEAKEREEEIAKEKRIQELKPKGMSDSNYKLYLDKGIHTVINVVQNILELNFTLNSENEDMKQELEKLKLELTQYKSNDDKLSDFPKVTNIKEPNSKWEVA